MRSLVLAPVVGLLLSFAIEALLRPRLRPVWQRPARGLALHCGLWLLVFAPLCVVLGRPWFAIAATSAFLLLIVLVNNAKYHSLEEPFIFQDFEYFTDAIRHPRLYIPFLGWGNAIGAGLGFVAAIATGLWLEPALPDRFVLAGPLGGMLEWGALGAILTAFARRGPPVRFEPEADLQAFGLLPCLWAYGRAERQPLRVDTPFADLARAAPDGERPHIVAVQSESFFDPRPYFDSVRRDVLAAFDTLKGEAIAHGNLHVPAWGANTVRSEFAFLTGLDEASLGVHRFNPYRKAARTPLASIASVLRQRGYRTLCIHPYPASFYARDKVFPLLGFDEFVDFAAFSDAERCGPYVGDAAVARMVAERLAAAREPLFVFVITMENHGPLHLETASREDEAAQFTHAPPPGCNDLTVYLRHLRNADSMIATLRVALNVQPRPGLLCWYGDHVPIMPTVYRQVARPAGTTDYVLWSTRKYGPADAAEPLAIKMLGRKLLEAANAA